MAEVVQHLGDRYDGPSSVRKGQVLALHLLADGDDCVVLAVDPLP